MARKVALRKFKVVLHGRNLLLNLEKVEKHGVYVVRFVEAVDNVSAGQTALDNFGPRRKERGCGNSCSMDRVDPPVFEAEEVTEVESFPASTKPTGLIFYPEAGDDDEA